MEEFRQACKTQIKSIKLDLEKPDNLKEKQINKLFNLTKDTPIIKENVDSLLEKIQLNNKITAYPMVYNIQDLKIILIHFYYIKLNLDVPQLYLNKTESQQRTYKRLIAQNKDKLLSLLFKSCKKEYDNQYNLKKSYIEQNPFKVNHDVIKQKLQELEDNYIGEREDYQVCAVFDLCDYLMDDPKSSYFTDYN